MIKVGAAVTMRVSEIDNRGRINLTLLGAPQHDGSAVGVFPVSTAIVTAAGGAPWWSTAAC